VAVGWCSQYVEGSRWIGGRRGIGRQGSGMQGSGRQESSRGYRHADSFLRWTVKGAWRRSYRNSEPDPRGAYNAVRRDWNRWGEGYDGQGLCAV
jgi:hypothetical protein